MGKKLDVIEYKIHSEKLPATFHGCRIAFLSDLHNKSVGTGNKVLLEALYQRNPDYVLCGGDMIVGKEAIGCGQALELLEVLGRKYPVYYSMGNHEEKAAYFNPEGFADCKKKLCEAGVRILDNESVCLEQNGEKILLSGLTLGLVYYTKWWKAKPLEKGQLKDYLGGQKSRFQILLAHNPLYFEEYEAYGADLVLSGHVHGGLIRLPLLGGVISPSYQLFPKYDYGRFQKGDTTMLLSRGLGWHTIPIRIHNHPELTMVTLQKKLVFSNDNR